MKLVVRKTQFCGTIFLQKFWQYKNGLYTIYIQFIINKNPIFRPRLKFRSSKHFRSNFQISDQFKILPDNFDPISIIRKVYINTI